MIINRSKNSMSTYDFEIINNNKKLRIFFAGNLDLYMQLSNGELISSEDNTILDFDITKENYDIYSIFDSLYKSIINGEPFSDDLDLLEYSNYIDYKNRYEYKNLVDKDLNINWISDDGPTESEDMIRVSVLDEDTYRLLFFRNNIPLDIGIKNPFGITIRFRNSGSKYEPFNCVFMQMFHKLQSIDPEYHQIHMEEIKYLKKMK